MTRSILDPRLGALATGGAVGAITLTLTMTTSLGIASLAALVALVFALFSGLRHGSGWSAGHSGGWHSGTGGNGFGGGGFSSGGGGTLVVVVTRGTGDAEPYQENSEAWVDGA